MSKIIPNIPKKFEGEFPSDYQNSFPYWGFFSREEIEANKGKLLMLDVDFGRYCSLACPGCFRRNNIVDDTEEDDLTYSELIKVIDKAKDLGLQSVKICGVGEPTQNNKFLQFVREMTERDVGVAIFTKGQVLGSDKETRKFNKNYGIESAQELSNVLYDLKTSIMLGFQSFDTKTQDQMFGKAGHTLVRNRALENLVNAGFNIPNPTRLALVNAPVTNQTYNEAFDIYVYGRERNIYPVTAVLMTSGKQIDKEFLKKHDMTSQQKIDLWTRIYSWNIDHGLQTLEQIREEGVSVLPGAHPCNQLAVGIYVTAKGGVIGCPGFTQVEGNVRKEGIKEIWERSQNKKLRVGVFNCKCPPKEGITVPSKLYEKVLEGLEEKYL